MFGILLSQEMKIPSLDDAMKVNAKHHTSSNFIIRSYNYTHQRRKCTSLDLATIKIHIIHRPMIQMQIICTTLLLQQVQKHSSIVSIDRSARKPFLSVFCNQPRKIRISTIHWHCAHDPLVFNKLQRSWIDMSQGEQQAMKNNQDLLLRLL